MNKNDLKIVFLGTPDFAVESLDRLVSGGYNIVGVVTMPDKPAGRGHNMLQSPVKKYAVQHGLKLMQPVRLKDEAFISELASLHADLFIVIAFRMLPEVVWRMPPMGTFNLHASLLPRYRGAAPINWAIINGDTRTGVTTFFLKHEIDTGDVIDQMAVDITPDDNVGTLHDRLMHLGADLTISTVERILARNLKPIAQDEMSGGGEATLAPKIFKDTCKIDWSRSAADIHNLVRGLSPYPAAWTDITVNGKVTTMKIFKTAVTDMTATGKPGQMVVEGSRVYINCADRRLEILNLQVQGKRPTDAAAFVCGLH